MKVFVISLFAIAILAFSTVANSKPLAVTHSQGVTITLTDEDAKCEAIPKFVYKVIWEENGKKFEGCFNVHGPIVVAYFPADKSIAIMPAQVFQPLSSM